MGGRKPHPYSMMAENNDQNHLTKRDLRERKKNEPTIESRFLKCPAHLSPEAKKEWRRIVKLYDELNVPILTDLDTNALEVYCESFTTYKKAIARVRETSEVYVNKSDQNKPKKNPWLTVANEAALQMKKYGDVLLLDPVSRARAGMVKKNPKDMSPMQHHLMELEKRRKEEEIQRRVQIELERIRREEERKAARENSNPDAVETGVN